MTAMTQALFRFDPLSNPGAGTVEARRRYLDEQAPRFHATIERCLALRPDKNAVVLDVGRSKLSSALLEHYDRVATLGLSLDLTRHYAHSEGWDPPTGKSYAAH